MGTMERQRPARPNINYLLSGAGAEERLVEGLRRGDVDAYRLLYEAFAPRLLRVVERITHDAQLARDAVQETFAIVFCKIERFEGRSGVRTWMTRICIREAQRLAGAQPRQAPAVAPSAVTPQTWPEEQAARAELYRQMERRIAALPIEKRTAFLLFELEGFSAQEISEITGEPYGTVLSRLARTRAELRAALEEWAEGAQVSIGPTPHEDVHGARR
jgi:RNA polymerase sigma-70 factor, ECF subfamily